MKSHIAGLTLLAALCGPLSIQAHASSLTLVSGGASISRDGETVNVSTDSPVLEWSSFSVAAGQTVDFVQAAGSARVFNRVGGATLEIFGVLQSNRPLSLIADNIFVAPGGVIDVPELSLVASQSINMSGLLRGSGVLTIEAPSLYVQGPLVSDGVVLQAEDYRGSGNLTLGSNGGSFSALTMTMANIYPMPILIDTIYSVELIISEPIATFAPSLNVELSLPVPEPSGAAMLAAGLLMLFGLRRKGAGGASTRSA